MYSSTHYVTLHYIILVVQFTGAYCVGGLLGPRACLKAVAKRNLCLCLESNPSYPCRSVDLSESFNEGFLLEPCVSEWVS